MTSSKVLKILPQRVQWCNRIGGFMPMLSSPFASKSVGIMDCIYKYSSCVPFYDSIWFYRLQYIKLTPAYCISMYIIASKHLENHHRSHSVWKVYIWGMRLPETRASRPHPPGAARSCRTKGNQNHQIRSRWSSIDSQCFFQRSDLHIEWWNMYVWYLYDEFRDLYIIYTCAKHMPTYARSKRIKQKKKTPQFKM